MNQSPDYLTPYETWNLTLISPPSHSRLYALEPLGLNTPYVESLTSYLTRLAEAHSVSLRILTTQEILPLMKRDYLSNPMGNSLGAFWIEAARALNGTGILAQDWAHVLESLTLRSDLRFLTLLPWTAVLTQQRLLRPTKAWCPDCFMECRDAGYPIYEPLLWSMRAVSLCPRHLRPLVEQCPHPDCCAKLSVLASDIRPGYCSKCSKWLGVITGTSNLPQVTEQWLWQIWVAKMVGKLVTHNMELTVMPHLGNIPGLITAFREQAADGSLPKMAEKLQLSRRTLSAWHLSRQVPQIESLLRLCYCCGVSLFDLFTLQLGSQFPDKLNIRTLPNIPNPFRNRRSRIPLDMVRIRESLKAELACEERPPPSMRAVSKRLNYSPKELREHFPELCRAISKRRKDYYQSQRIQRIEQQKAQVRQATIEIHSQGLYPSSHRVGLLLSEPAIMRSPVMLKFWREILEELELAD